MFDELTFPPTVVNGYLWHTMKQIEPSLEKKYRVAPFFPVSDNVSGDASWNNKTYIIYDRMMRITRDPFYPIKNDHIMYFLKSNEKELFTWGMAIQYILDREDDAAQDVNEWNRSQAHPANVYFHNLRVYETDTGDMGTATLTRDFSTRPNFVSRFVIDAKYHFTDSIEDHL